MKKKHTVETIIPRPVKVVQFGDGAFARSVFGRVLASANENGENANCIIIADKPFEKKQFDKKTFEKKTFEKKTFEKKQFEKMFDKKTFEKNNFEK